MGRMSAVLVAVLLPLASSAAAQSAAERQALAGQIEQRFDVLPVQGGVVLTPKAGNRDFRSIQLTGGTIAIDGDPVTGAELRRRLDADADLVLRLSYLDGADQRALFAARQPRAPVPPSAPAAPVAPVIPAAPAAPAPPEAPAPPRRPNRSSDRVRIGGGVEVATNEIVNGDVVAIGGGANVDGQVRGEVVAIGGGLTLGPNADVEGDVTVVGGPLRRDPAARIGGEIHEVAFGDMDFWPGSWGPFPRGNMPGRFFDRPFGSVFALVGTITRVAVYSILAAIVLLFARPYVERLSLRAASEPLKAGAVGLLIQLLFFPVLIASIVIMVITIIGIPLLVLVPFALVAFLLLCLVGFIAVAYDVGRLAVIRFGGDAQNHYLVAAIGMALVVSPILLSRLVGFAGPVLWPIAALLLFLGFFAEWAAWTVGLGSVALVRFDRKEV